MKLAKKIFNHIQRLPESSQAEVLDFIEFLEAKVKKDTADEDWTNTCQTQCVVWKMNLSFTLMMI